jgi:hypothetical protein
MYLAVFHLLAHGHKNITFVGLNPDLYTMMERYKSCASVMRAARLPENAYLDASRGDALERYIERLDAHETTALFCRQQPGSEADLVHWYANIVFAYPRNWQSSALTISIPPNWCSQELLSFGSQRQNWPPGS